MTGRRRPPWSSSRAWRAPPRPSTPWRWAPRPAGNRDAGLPPHPHQPAQRPLRRRHRLSPRGRGGEDRPPPPAVIDNLELLVDQNEDERFADERSLSGKIEELFARDLISAQALNFIRGRSVTKTYLIIDEAQNLTPKQAKGIITRAGMGTKIILLGAQPDRQPPPGRAHQRPELRRRNHEGKPPVLPGHPLRRGVRAVGPGHRRGAADVTAPLRLKSIIPCRARGIILE